MAGKQHPWEHLLATAQQEVGNTLRALPPPVRRQAIHVPVAYEPRPTQEMLPDNLPTDTLGLFVGEAFPDAYAGTQDLPAQILLFLENIWDYAGHDLPTYRAEVRRTLLHELGHYLGLDEDGLAERDLD